MKTKRSSGQPAKLSRRDFLKFAGIGAGALALGSYGLLQVQQKESTLRVSQASATGSTKEYIFTASPLDFELGGNQVKTWGYNEVIPGPEIRLAEGDTLSAKVQNGLPEGTTIHWHGLAVPNAMDGVPDTTQSAIKSGEDFTYEFTVPTAGTYLYHSHMGLQLDRGLYGPLIIEPKQEELSYDREYTLLLDDWLDGVKGTPEDALKKLKGSGGGMMMGTSMVDYPYYLVNGRTADDPETLKVRQGETVRLRLINAGAETLFHFAVAGHKLTVTHTDGLPVEPVTVDTLLLGMSERYDVLLEASNPGVWQVAAAPDGKSGMGRALLRYEENSQSSPPSAKSSPRELKGKSLKYSDLKAKGLEPLSGKPDRTHKLTLSGGMGSYEWSINGQLFPNAEPLPVRKGEHVRVQMQNQSMMFHSMHLHGHSFQVQTSGGNGPYKDTALVDPHMGTLAFDFVANNPGEWLFHCHNQYHMESGLGRVVSYKG